jgi:hypothetical protein
VSVEVVPDSGDAPYRAEAILVVLGPVPRACLLGLGAEVELAPPAITKDDLLGTVNGVMDEPAVDVHVEGSRVLVAGTTWPPKEVEHRALYLRPRGKPLIEPEPMGAEHAALDGFYLAPLTALDEERSAEGSPVHPHTRAVQVDPHSVEEYVLRVYPRSRRPSCRGTGSSSSSRTPSRWPMSTTRCCHRTFPLSGRRLRDLPNQRTVAPPVVEGRRSPVSSPLAEIDGHLLSTTLWTKGILDPALSVASA